MANFNTTIYIFRVGINKSGDVLATWDLEYVRISLVADDDDENSKTFTANSWLQTHVLRDNKYVETQKQHEVEIYPDTEKEFDPGKHFFISYTIISKVKIRSFINNYKFDLFKKNYFVEIEGSGFGFYH